MNEIWYLMLVILGFDWILMSIYMGNAVYKTSHLCLKELGNFRVTYYWLNKSKSVKLLCLGMQIMEAVSLISLHAWQLQDKS